ncbi:MAG: DMT family transporter [Hyphomicrobiaceae bacterium]
MAPKTDAEAGQRSASLPLAGLLMLIALTIVWGVNWPVMKLVLVEIPVWWFRAVCLIFGGFGLLAIALATGSRVFCRWYEVGPLILTTIFAVAGWHICSGYGVSLMPAGRAVIIAFTMPIWAALFAWAMLGETLSRLKVLGLGLGVAGLAVLIGPDLAVLETAPIGALFMLGSAVCWGLGTVLFKRFNWTIPVVANMAWQLLISAVPVTAIALAFEPVPDPLALSTPVAWSMVYILLLPMTFGQWAYFTIVRMFPASVAALGTLAIPVVGVYSSALLLGEPIGAAEVLSLTLICAALAVILVLPSVLARRSRA